MLVSDEEPSSVEWAPVWMTSWSAWRPSNGHSPDEKASRRRSDYGRTRRAEGIALNGATVNIRGLQPFASISGAGLQPNLRGL